MKIREIQTVVVNAERGRTWMFVEVHTGEGLTGVGECSQSRHDRGVAADIEALKPLYLGRDPLNLIEERSLLLRRPEAGRVRHAAVSGLEQALWDLCGKALGVPVYKLLGGSVQDRVRLYANISLAAGNQSPAEYARAAERAVAEGFTAVKINILDPVLGHAKLGSSGEYRRLRDEALARVKAVREAIGPSVDLLTDWHLVLPPAEARQLAASLGDYDLFWIEEPFLSEDPALLAEFRRGIGTRLTAAEQLISRRSYRHLLEARTLDVLMPDVKWLGGISEARKVAAMAEAYEVEVAPHNLSGPVATAASLHLSLTLPNFLILEYCWGGVPWRADLVKGTERIEAGYMTLPTAPGLGIEWDAKAARANSCA